MRWDLEYHLEPVSDGVHLLLGDLDLSSHHVGRLFGVERVRHAADHEHVDLHTSTSVLLISLRPVRVAQARSSVPRGRRRREGRADGRRQGPRTAGSVWWSGTPHRWVGVVVKDPAPLGRCGGQGPVPGDIPDPTACNFTSCVDAAVGEVWG